MNASDSENVRSTSKISKPSRTLDDCQAELWELQEEIRSLSFLFRYLGPCELNQEQLYGTGVTLERIQKRLERVTGWIASA